MRRTLPIPKLEGSTLELHQVAPGEYEGRFPINDNGNYFVNVVQYRPDGAGGSVPAAAQAAGLAVSYSPEYRELEPNTFLLNQLQSSSLAPEGVDLRSVFTQATQAAAPLGGRLGAVHADGAAACGCSTWPRGGSC